MSKRAQSTEHVIPEYEYISLVHLHSVGSWLGLRHSKCERLHQDRPVGVLDNIAAKLAAELNTSSPASPKYAQLYEQILRTIEGDDWNPGDRLPPDSEFARVLPVSLGTVQRALNLLAGDGVIAPRHGHGTFVSDTATPE